jgi:hypothetical protein
MYNNEKERTESNASFNTASVWTEIFRDLKPYLNVYYEANSAKILEPNYSYYNLKIWTAFFMENNIYLENKHFYISDLDTNVAFKSKQEFFAYKKKEDENKFMNYQSKYEDLLKLAAETYYIIKDNNISLTDQISNESKKLLEELKPKLDQINKSRLMKKELVDKLKGKKDNKTEEKKENGDKEEEKKEDDKKEEDKKEGDKNTEEVKTENNAEKELNDGNKEESNNDTKKEGEVNGNEIKDEENKDTQNDGDKKEETKDEDNKDNKENEAKNDTEQIDQ